MLLQLVPLPGPIRDLITPHARSVDEAVTLSPPNGSMVPVTLDPAATWSALLVLAIVLSPILMFGVSWWPALMQRFGISPELVGPMRPFLMALNWGTLPLLGYFALRRYLQAVNVAVPIMFALISANIVNAFGDWVLIYGHLGFRAQGITGSGWSTCAARTTRKTSPLPSILASGIACRPAASR